MLIIAGNDNQFCPYRDCLAIDTSSGRVSWYQLLSVSQEANQDELLHRWNQRRTLVAHKRTESGNPVWDDILDELDRALAVLSHPRKKADYDDDLSRRRRQTSLIRPRSLNTQDAYEFRESTRPAVSEKPSKESPEVSVRTRFEPLRVIGRGQQGTKVFEAHEFTLGRSVAVKCLEKAARTESRCRSFLEEAKFLASISHPNLVEVHSVNEKNCCFVMECLGQSVRDKFQPGRTGGCSPDQVTQFLEQGLSVLQCLHDRGVVHGAISLKSFLVTESGVIKLIDAPGCTRAGLFRSPDSCQTCVAPELLSPETFGEPKGAVDLYMLGYAAVELLAGDRLPKWFRKISTVGEPDQKQWLRWHASPFEKLPSLEPLVPGISSKLASIIETLCQKQVSDRYRTASDAIRDLESVQSSANGRMVTSSTDQSGNSVDALPGVRKVAGEAPNWIEPKTDVQPTHDLLEILQDPTLIWQLVTRHKKAQAIAVSALAFMLVFMLLPSDAAPNFAASSPPDDGKSFKKKVDQPERLPAEVPVQKSLETPSPYTDLEEVELVILPIRPEKQAPAAPQEMRPVQNPRFPILQTPTVRPFAVANLKDPEKFQDLKRILTDLKNARGGNERERLLLEARDVAPKDPRPSFIFAAINEFGPKAKEELRNSVLLSGPEFTQPFRMSIEAVLRSSSRETKIADQVLAELVRFRDQLHDNSFTPMDAYDWEWIGRVLGYMERIAPKDDSFRTMLTSNKPRIVNGIHSDAAACIERGRVWILQHPVEDFTAHTVFPPSPMVEINLCLGTLAPPAANAPISSTDNGVAALPVSNGKLVVLK